MGEVRAIFAALLQFFVDHPQGDRAEFVAGAPSTPGKVNLFLDQFLLTGHHMLILDAADFDTLMERMRTAPDDRIIKAARGIFERLKVLPVFVEYARQERLVLVDGIALEYQGKLTMAETARAWVAANAPGSAEQKAAALQAMDLGIQQMHVIISQMARERAKLES